MSSASIKLRDKAAGADYDLVKMLIYLTPDRNAAPARITARWFARRGAKQAA